MSDNWIQLAGSSFFAFDGPQDFKRLTIQRLANSLATINRFHGATKFPVSVATHSVLVSRLVEDAHGCKYAAKAALMHDAHECVIGDIPTPIKRYLESVPGFRERFDTLERNVISALKARFGYGCAASTQLSIKFFDAVALETERRDAMESPPRRWATLPHASRKYKVKPMSVEQSARLFVRRWNELSK